MFLFFLRSNLSEFLFKKIIYHLASEFPDEQKDNRINATLAREMSVGAKTAPPMEPSQTATLRIDEVDTPLLYPSTSKLE